MGDSKRRKTTLGDKYGDPDQELVFPKLKAIPLTKGQARLIYEWSTRGAWIGIGALAVLWIMVRFVGPLFGWWQVI
jgi:hypothetical protein